MGSGHNIIMPIARTKMTIYDEVYDLDAFQKFNMINYQGPHPEKLYAKIRELAARIFMVPEHYFQEYDYNWGRNESSEKFKVSWFLTMNFDTHTFIRVEVDFSGKSKEGYGNAKIKIYPNFQTQYPQDTMWQQSMIYNILLVLWHRVFYASVRDKYLREARNLMDKFMDEIKKYSEELKINGT